MSRDQERYEMLGVARKAKVPLIKRLEDS